MKKNIVKILIGVVVIFCLINVIWYVVRAATYNRYSVDMKESVFSTFLTPNYEDADDEGFTYGVYYPEYLRFTGNLFVGFPSEDENNPYTNSLIIWPLKNGEYEYGVLLYVDNVQYQIYVDKNGEAIYEKDKSIVSENAQQISILIEKANSRWDLDK